MAINLMGFREYAESRKQRGLPGTTLSAVQKAIDSGRISTVPDDKGRRKIDPDVADIQWAKNTDPDQAARANGGKTAEIPAAASVAVAAGSNDWLAAKTRRELAEAQKAEIQLLELAGKLVSRDRVEAAAFSAGRMVRDMLLTVPQKLAGELIEQSDPVIIENMIRKQLRSVLEELARQTTTVLEEAIAHE